MGMKVAAGGASSVRAKHTRLALSKALNVTINRAPTQASLRKMLKKVKGAKDHGDLLQGFFNDGDDDGASGASGSVDAAAENTKADEALAQVILGVCEDTETHFESLVQEKHVNAEFDALDAWIQEAQETLLRKRARAEANGGQTDDEEHQEVEIDAKLISPELLVLAERQRVVNEELQQLQKLRAQKAAQLAQIEKTVEFARRAALNDIDKAQHAVTQVDSVRDLVKDYASSLKRERARKRESERARERESERARERESERARERAMDLYEDDDGNLQQHEFQGNTMMTHTSMSLTGLSISSFASDYSANSSAKNEGECGHEEERGRLELSTSLWSDEGNGSDRCENDEAVDLRSPRTIDEEKGYHDDEGQIGHDEERQEDGDNAEGDGDAQMESELKCDVENEETTGIAQHDTQRDMQVPDSKDGGISPDETNDHQSAAPEAIVTPGANLPDHDQRVQDFGENDSDNSEAPVHPVETSSLFDKDGDTVETQQGTQQIEITSAPIALPCLPIPSPPAPVSDGTFSFESVATAKQGEVRCAVSDHEEEAKSPAPPVPHAIPSPLHYTLCDLFPVVFEEKQTPFSRKKAPSQAPNKCPSTATSATKSPLPASTSKARNTKSGSSRITQQGQQRDQSVHDQLDRTQKQLKAATQTIKMHQVVEAEKKQLAQRNARLRQQLDTLIADLQRTKAENAKLVAENELYAAKLPHLQAELLQESCHADETQAQAVQMQLSLTQLKARVHVLQTRNGNIETQLEKQHVELRTCKQELRRKAAAVHATTEKLTKAETEMSHMKNRHAQDILQWKTKLATMQQKWDADTAKRDREANLKMVDALRDAKAHAGTTMKKNAALEARVLQLEDELKHSKRDADARQRDLITQVNQVRTLERLLRKCHHTEATLRNDVALLRANAKSASMEKRGVYSNEMRRDRDVSQKSRRSNLRRDASLFPLDLLLLATDSDSDDSGEHLCACDSRSLARPMRKDVACATEPSRCLKCEDAAEQVRAAQSEIQRLRLLHSKELNVQAMAFTRALSSHSQPSSDNVNGMDISRLSSTSSA